MYCIIDWHILNPDNPLNHLADAKEFFAIMAQQHAGKKGVIYEIGNEPNGVDWATIKSYAEQVIPIIRQYDKEAIILVGTPQWSGSPGEVAGNPLTGANAYNVMYTFHFYAGSHYTQEYIDGVLKTVPLFISEWGISNYSGNGGNDYGNAQKWIDLLSGKNSSGIKVSWCNWSFADKDESSAALNPGACNSNNWNNTSPSGAWVKDHILNPADDFGPPTSAVAITTPANNATVSVGSNLVVTAAVSNTSATAVEFYNGTTKLGTVTAAPYAWTVGQIAKGTYSFTAKAILSSGNPLVSSAVQVTATPAPNQPPTVSLTAPASNATFTAPATIAIAANATDSDGSVAKVVFYNGTTKLGEDTSAPYAFSWSSVTAGSYTITAKAIDNQGAATTSGATIITVRAAPATPSTATVLGPDCVAKNAVQPFELNANNLPSATAFSWWVNGSTQRISGNQTAKATISFGPYFTGGQVCVGVNYSASPWYVQYCKNVAVCAPTRVGDGLETIAVTVTPNPTSDHFTLTAPKDIRAIHVIDQLGREWVQLGAYQRGQRISLGSQLPAGPYLIQIRYEDKTNNAVKVLKVGK